MPLMTVTCAYELGATLGTTPVVDVALSSSALTRSEGGLDYTVHFPPTDGHSGVFNDSRVQIAVICPGFTVDVSTTLADMEALAATLEDALAGSVKTAALVADRIRVTQPTTGLVGVPPKMLSCKLTVDGRHHESHAWHRYLARKPIVVGSPIPSAAAIQAALDSGDDLPIHELLLAQASHSIIGKSVSSMSAAVLLAAVACEIRIKQVLFDQASTGQLALLEMLIPANGSARASMKDIVKKCFPLVLGRSLVDENAQLYNAYLELAKARNSFSHTGQSVPEEEALSHYRTAHGLLEWIDDAIALTT